MLARRVMCVPRGMEPAVGSAATTYSLKVSVMMHDVFEWLCGGVWCLHTGMCECLRSDHLLHA